MWLQKIYIMCYGKELTKQSKCETLRIRELRLNGVGLGAFNFLYYTDHKFYNMNYYLYVTNLSYKHLKLR